MRAVLTAVFCAEGHKELPNLLTAILYRQAEEWKATCDKLADAYTELEDKNTALFEAVKQARATAALMATGGRTGTPS